MSEKLYGWLLRLYPSRFRKAYAEEALQLFRDRAGHERGFFPVLRLWIDLLADLTVSIPRQHFVRPRVLGASVGTFAGGVPSFYVLESESLRFGPLLMGSMISLASFGACTFLINHWGPHRPIFFSLAAGHGAAWSRLPALSRSSPPEATTSGSTDSPLATDDTRHEPLAPALDQARVIRAVSDNLRQHYLDPQMAKRITGMLLANESRGSYDEITDGGDFARLLTSQIGNLSHDRQLVVVYSRAVLPDLSAGPPPGALERYRQQMEQCNCTFATVQFLPNNVGYLKFDSFPDPSVCRSTAAAAMASLDRADAVIFDLRENGGGHPEMVAFLAAYLFDHPEYLYNPRENTTERSWTRSPVPGSRLAHKPVYLLTSSRTFSGAEQFAYDLKVLKRATLVGETTGGAAHAGRFHRIDDHFGIGIPEAHPINPYSTKGWEGAGVEPDVKVKAADALATAEKLVRAMLAERR